VTSCGAHEANTPDTDDPGRNSLDGESLGHHDGRVGADNESKIEDGGREGVPVAGLEPEVGSEAEQRLV